jgi:hypothetical protein
MNLKRFITSAAVALLPLAASAATFVVPAAGAGQGVNGSQWQTELTLHSGSSSTVSATLLFHDRNGAAESATVQIAPRGTVSIGDIVRTRFNRESATGAIEITVDDAFARKLAITSRTFNRSENGEFGQDIPAVAASAAVAEGSSIAINGPSNAAETRFNFGLYALEATDVRWELVRADGTLGATTTASYAAGVQTQYNAGVSAFLGANADDNDVVLAVITRGRALGYGSAVNNHTGDPTYIPGVETRADIRVQFLGLDTNLSGTVTIADADHDGVLDAPVSVYVSFPWPTSFRLVVDGPQPRFELLTPSPDITLQQDGIVIWKSSISGGSSTTTLKVRITVGGVSDVITIPVQYK